MDNETKIAQSLASNLPSSGPQDYSYPEPEAGDSSPQPESGLAPEVLEDPFQKYQTKQEILKYFDVPTDKINQVSEDIDQIIDFVKKEVGSFDLTEIINYLNSTERMIGSRLSPNRLHKLRQFATIRHQRRLLEQKERTLYA